MMSPEQVRTSNQAQQSGRDHPFTCMRQSCDKSQILIATEKGWTCPCGKYRETGAEHG